MKNPWRTFLLLSAGVLALRAKVAGWLDGESLHGSIARAGLPKTMATA